MFMVQVNSEAVRSHKVVACVGQLVHLGDNPPGSGWWIVIRSASEEQRGLAVPAMFPHGFELSQTNVTSKAA